jgi:hypothetical protein
MTAVGSWVAVGSVILNGAKRGEESRRKKMFLRWIPRAARNDGSRVGFLALLGMTAVGLDSSRGSE